MPTDLPSIYRGIIPDVINAHSRMLEAMRSASFRINHGGSDAAIRETVIVHPYRLNEPLSLDGIQGQWVAIDEGHEAPTSRTQAWSPEEY